MTGNVFCITSLLVEYWELDGQGKLRPESRHAEDLGALISGPSSKRAIRECKPRN